MTEQQDLLERRLERTLAAHADRLHDTPFGLADVRARAHRIRRRRGAAAAASVLAVAAVIVPLGLLGGDGHDGDAIHPAGPVGTTVPYVRDGVVMRGGETVRLPVDPRTDGKIVGLAPLADGRMVLATDGPAGRQVMVLDAEGQGLAGVSLRGPVVGTPDGSAAAWLTRDGVPMLVRDGQPPREQTPYADRAPGLVADAVHCVRTCTITASLHDGGGSLVREWDETGDQRRLDMLTAIDDVSPDGQRYVDVSTVVDQECAALYEPAATGVESFAWTDCGRRDYEFSPDGETLAAFETGGGDGVLSVVDAASGEVRATFDEHTYADFTWEDSTHLLAVHHGEEGWRLVRLGVDGSDETLLGPLPGDRDNPPIVLPDR